ncbi:putative NACHT, LRR and PYD domains-containing protein 10-like [Apostichopus japonicus]|uniref:Putative NACHT, LRR and PYD domains-containing protein 10-like n=1 Tax=Stichopus japonicus TaxID=307972 RepID=A0A2G8LA46_STIJA|nr:putative NACHT, LRR and PYD domains-containing protein 10-like [Apostichopus japonicus]
MRDECGSVWQIWFLNVKASFNGVCVSIILFSVENVKFDPDNKSTASQGSDEREDDDDHSKESLMEREELPKQRQDSQVLEKRHLHSYIEHRINYEGGTISIMGVHLTIPEDALSFDHVIAVKVIYDPDIHLPGSARRGRITPLLKIEPEGLTLNKPAQLTIPHSAIIPEPDRHDVIIFTGLKDEEHLQEGEITWTEEKSIGWKLDPEKISLDINILSYVFVNLVSQETEQKHVFRIVPFIDGILDAKDDVLITVCFCKDSDEEYKLLLEDHHPKLCLGNYTPFQITRTSNAGRDHVSYIDLIMSSPGDGYHLTKEESTKHVDIDYLCAANRVSHQFRLTWDKDGDTDMVDVKLKVSQHEMNQTTLILQLKVKDILLSPESQKILHPECQVDVMSSLSGLHKYEKLRGDIAKLLDKQHCLKLGIWFRLKPAENETIQEAAESGEMLMKILDERELIMPERMIRLYEGLKAIHFNKVARLVLEYIDTSQEKNGKENEGGKDDNKMVKLPEKREVISKRTLKLLVNYKMLIKEGYNRLDAQSALILTKGKLDLGRRLLLLAKEEHGKENLFIKCLQQKMKTWFETMTPVPWKKSCQWKPSDLFIASGLVLTTSGSNISSREVDQKCKLHYLDIFTDERLKAETRIILEGQPGSGKTMLSSQFAYDWCCGKLDIPMVIYLPLKIVDNMTIVQTIKMFYISKGIPITEEDIESMLTSSEKEVLLILDGLEEYNGGTKDDTPSEVMRVMTKEKLSNCIVMITARTDYAKDLPRGPMLKIGSFGEDERNEYIEKVYSDDLKKQEEVKELIDNVPFILHICNVPLLLVLLVHNIDRLGKVPEPQLDRVTPFLKAIVDILCSVQDEEETSGHLLYQQQGSICEEDGSRSESEVSIEPHITLEELAFNGLCKGNQQLFWEKDFVDRSVSNSKTWIDAGILVEEGTPFNSPSRDLQTNLDSESPQNDSISNESLYTFNVTSAMKRGYLLIMISWNLSINQRINQYLESKEKKSEPLQKGNAVEYVSLQVRFLDKLIQEWFAAKYLARLFCGQKSTEHHYKYQLFREHLANIDPADLHYVLRFTCHICPHSFHFIASFLMRDL